MDESPKVKQSDFWEQRENVDLAGLKSGQKQGRRDQQGQM